MGKVWHSGNWFFDNSLNSWCYLKAGEYEPGVMLSPDDYSHCINSHEVTALIAKLDEQGWIKPRLDERLRAEDLKIMHRLLDLLEKK